MLSSNLEGDVDLETACELWKDGWRKSRSDTARNRKLKAMAQKEGWTMREGWGARDENSGTE